MDYSEKGMGNKFLRKSRVSPNLEFFSWTQGSVAEVIVKTIL